MGKLRNGCKRANGGNGALRDPPTPDQKKVIASNLKQKIIQREMEILFPRVSVLDIGKFLEIFMPGCIQAFDSVNGLNGLKRFLHDNIACKFWLKENVGLNGHIPGSWGRITLAGTGKMQIGPKMKKISRKNKVHHHVKN